MNTSSLLWKEISSRKWTMIVGLGIMVPLAALTPLAYTMAFTLVLMYFDDFTFASYVWNAWWGQGGWQLGYVFAIILGMNILGNEKDKGVLEFLLTRNVTRKKVVVTKLLSDVGILWVAVILSTLALFLSAQFSGIGFYPEYSMMKGAVFACLTLTIPYSITALTAVFSRVAWKSFVTGAIWIVADISLYYLPQIPLSLTGAMADSTLFAQGTFPWLQAVGAFVAFAVLAFLTVGSFEKAEI